MFDFIFDRIRKKALASLSKKTVKRETVILKPVSTSSVLLLVDTPVDKYVADAVEYVKKEFPASTAIEIIVLETSKGGASGQFPVPEGGTVVPYSSIGRSGVPSSGAVAGIMQKKYDLLLDLSNKTFSSRYVMLGSAASFKISSGTMSGDYADTVLNNEAGGQLNKLDFVKNAVRFVASYGK